MKLTILHKLIISFFTVMIIITIIISCRKLDTRIERPEIDRSKRFLNVPVGSPSVLKRIAETIRKQNDQYGFLNAFAKKFGYPVWSKSPIFNPPPHPDSRGNHVPDTMALIPLVQDGINQVYSFLACSLGG